MKELLLTTAITMATKKGLAAVTKNGVAREAGVASNTVSYHFKSAPKLIAAVIAEGVRLKNLRIIGEALAIKHPAALAAPDALRRSAALHLATK